MKLWPGTDEECYWAHRAICAECIHPMWPIPDGCWARYREMFYSPVGVKLIAMRRLRDLWQQVETKEVTR